MYANFLPLHHIFSHKPKWTVDRRLVAWKKSFLPSSFNLTGHSDNMIISLLFSMGCRGKNSLCVPYTTKPM